MTGRARSGLILAVSVVFAVGLGACGIRTPSAPGSVETLQVVTTTTILADLVAQVGGPLVSVESLVPKGGEVHTFDPTPSDVRRLVDAKVVFRNGLGLDDWLATFATDAGTTAPIVALGEGLPGVAYLAGTGHAGETGQGVNPHLWLDISYAAKYAVRIGETLAAVDPAHAAAYSDGARAYAGTLAALDTETRTQLAAIPAADRVVISFHDAFPYFAAAYGLTVDGTIVDAPGQDPSAAKVEALVATVRAKGIKAIFTEAQFSDALARTIAGETGATVVSSLYTDSTGNAPQDSYVGMMRWNVAQVLGVLSRP